MESKTYYGSTGPWVKWQESNLYYDSVDDMDIGYKPSNINIGIQGSLYRTLGFVENFWN